MKSFAAKLFVAVIATNPQTKPTVREMSAVVLPPILPATIPAMRAAAPTVVDDIEDEDPTILIDLAAVASLLDRCENDDCEDQ